MIGVVGDRGEILKDFVNALFDKGVVAVFLDFNEIGNVDYFVNRTEFSSFCLHGRTTRLARLVPIPAKRRDWA